MCVEVRGVETRADQRAFLDLPVRLYRDDPLWVPTLHREVRRAIHPVDNPYFRQALVRSFICIRDQRAVARCVAVVHAGYAVDGRLPAHFGFFESENDPEAVRTLFDRVCSWCRDNGATDLRGPFNPTHYSELGLQIDQFEAPVTFFQTHHLPYYQRLLERAGFTVEKVLHTSRNPDIRRWLAGHPAPCVNAPGLTIRPVNMRRLSAELEKIREVYNDAFADNCFFLPVSREEYQYASSGLTLVTRPELNVIVEHGSEPVGVLQCMLDVNPLLQSMQSGRLTPWGALRFLTGRSRIRRLVVYAVGIKKKWQRGRVHALLFAALHRMAQDFDELETTWMSPDNPIALHAAARFGMAEHKHFAILSRSLTLPVLRKA